MADHQFSESLAPSFSVGDLASNISPFSSPGNLTEITPSTSLNSLAPIGKQPDLEISLDFEDTTPIYSTDALAMAPSEPTTPVKVPKAASNYSPSTQDPELRSNINALLLSNGHIQKIHTHLLHSLNASSTNWPSVIQSYALSLLRSGEYTTFPQLMNRVLEDIKRDTAMVRKKGTEDLKGSGHGVGGQSLALPKNVVEDGLKVTRECLEAVCILEG